MLKCPKADLGANLPKTANEELKEGLKLLGKVLFFAFRG